MFQSGTVNDNQLLVLQSRYCESTHMWYFAGVLYAVKGLHSIDPISNLSHFMRPRFLIFKYSTILIKNRDAMNLFLWRL